MSLLSIENLTKEYSRAGQIFKAVNNVNLQVKKGSFVNIVGRSGSGKTTLLNMISGLLKVTSGVILFDGDSLCNMTDAELCVIRNKKMGFIPQGNSLLSNLNVSDNVRLPYYMFGKEEVSGRVEYLLDKLGIPHLANFYPNSLSGGEMRRVAIARALVNDPDIIVADEPTSDLDALNTKAIMELLQEINKQGTTVLVVTHELENLGYGDTTFIMSDGMLSMAESNDKQSVLKQL